MIEARLVKRTAGRAVVRRSTRGAFDAQLHHAPQEQDDRGGGEQAERGAGGPAPVAALGDRQQEQHETGGQAERAQQVEGALGAHRGLRYDEEGEGDGEHAEAGGAVEEGVPVGVLGDQGGGGQGEAAADAYGGAHQGHRRAESFAGQHVAHQADAERDRAHREALERAAGDHEQQIAGERADQRADHHHREAEDQHAPLAVEVAEAAHDRGGHRAREQGRGQDPGGVARGGVQQLRQVLDDRHEQGLHHRDNDAREGEHRDHGPARSAGGTVCRRLRH